LSDTNYSLVTAAIIAAGRPAALGEDDG